MPDPDNAPLRRIILRALDAGRRLELRGAERTSVSLVTQVLCYPAGGGFAIATATVRNVSISGMLLETPQELHAGDAGASGFAAV
ncbi:MAG: hypothetical protein JOZ65_33155 [Chloroflexi bacterium]|nr:hypothetical protein [Chloroflexota bacterium]